MQEIGVLAIFDVSNFNKGLSDYIKGLNEATSATQNTSQGTSVLASALSGLKTVGAVALGGVTAAAGLAGLAIFKLGGYVREATGEAALVSEMGAVLNMMGERAGWSATQIQDNVRAMQDLGIRTNVAQNVLTQFARQQLDAADATMAARVAQDLAVLSHRDSSETLNELMYAIQTQNSNLQVTRDLGIQAGSAMKVFADSVGKSVEDLTQAERQQAMLNAVREAGVKIEGAYDAAMEEASKRMRSLSRHFYEARWAIGQAFLPAFGEVIGVGEQYILWVREAVEEGGQLRPIIESLGKVVGAVALGFGKLVMAGLEWLSTLAPTFDFIANVISALGSFIKLVSMGQDPLLSFQMLMHKLFPTEIALQINSTAREVSGFVSKIFEAIDPILQFIQENVKLQDILIVVGGAIALVLLPALKAIGLAILSVVAPAILAFVAAVALVAGLRAAWESDFLGMRTAVTEFWEGKVKPALDALVLFLQTAIPAAIEFVKNVIQTGLDFIAAFWAANGENIMIIVGAFMNTVSGIIETVINTISGIVSTVLDAIALFWDTHGETIQTAAQTIWDIITELIDAAMENIESVIAAIALAIEGDWEGFGEKLREVWDNTWETIKEVLDTAWDTLSGTIESIITSIIGFFQDTDWGSVGTSIIEGIASGISGAVDIVVGAVKGAASAAVDAATGFLGIQSPSKVFKQIGLDTMLGLEGGINAAAALPSQAVSNVVNNMTSPSNTTINNVRNVTNNNNFAFSQGGGSPNRNMFFGVLSAMETVSQ